jgi:hypothetical protein
MAILDVNPGSALDFGDVTTLTTSAVLTLVLTNNDAYDDIVVGTITSDNAAFAIGGGGVTLHPGDSANVNVTYTAGAPGTETGTMTIPADANNAPIQVFMTGKSVAAGTKSISISPSSWIFDPTKVGVDSATKTFTIKNTSTVNVTVQIPAVTAPFAGVGLPGAPTVLLPGTSMTFGVKFTPTGGGYTIDADGLAITSDAPSSVDNIDLEGMGVLINPAYVVAQGVERAYAALRETVKQFDATDLRSETAAFAERTLNLAGPGVEARLLRVQLQYENKGVSIVNVKATSERDQVAEQDVQTGTAAANSKVRNALADLKLQGEFVTIRISPQGALSLIAYIPRFTPAGEVEKV